MKVGDRIVALVDTAWFKKDAQGVVAEVVTVPDYCPIVQVVWDGGEIWWALEKELEVINES